MVADPHHTTAATKRLIRSKRGSGDAIEHVCARHQLSFDCRGGIERRSMRPGWSKPGPIQNPSRANAPLAHLYHDGHLRSDCADVTAASVAAALSVCERRDQASGTANKQPKSSGVLKFKFSAPTAGAYAFNFCIGPAANPCGLPTSYVVVVLGSEERLGGGGRELLHE